MLNRQCLPPPIGHANLMCVADILVPIGLPEAVAPCKGGLITTPARTGAADAGVTHDRSLTVLAVAVAGLSASIR